MKRALALLLLFVASGCVTGPPAETKSPLNYLNGRNYQQRGNVVVPVIERQSVATVVAGELLLASDPMPLPYRHQTLELVRRGATKPLLETTSDADGRFKFVGTIENGIYLVRLKSPKASASAEFEVKDYEVSELRLLAAPVSTR